MTSVPLFAPLSSADPTDELGRLVAELSRWRLPLTPESALQRGIDVALAEGRWSFRREVPLTAAERIDFLVSGRIGLEVKVDGSLSDVTRQLHRYAMTDGVAALLLVTTRAKHLELPDTLNGKPLRALHVTRGAF